MAMVSMRQVLDEAAEGGYGVGAFNVNNMEQLQGIVDAARETSSPVIVQASRGAIAYAGPNYLRHLIMAAAESAPEIPIVLHLDHGDKPGDLPHGDRARLHERDDGRLAARRRQDALGLRVQRRGHARGRRGARTRRASRSRASSARSAGSRTATAPARCT